MLTKYRHVLQDPDVLPIDKLLYVVIGNKSTPPDATNKELAACLGVCPRTITRGLQHLEQRGYIHMELENRNKRTIRHKVLTRMHPLDKSPYKPPFRGKRPAGGTYPEEETTPTAPRKTQTADWERKIKRGFKRLYTGYTGLHSRYGRKRADYLHSYFTYRRLVEVNQNRTALYNWIIAYRDERINNGREVPPLDEVLQQLLYRSLIKPLT